MTLKEVLLGATLTPPYDTNVVVDKEAIHHSMITFSKLLIWVGRKREAVVRDCVRLSEKEIVRERG